MLNSQSLLNNTFNLIIKCLGEIGNDIWDFTGTNEEQSLLKLIVYKNTDFNQQPKNPKS